MDYSIEYEQYLEEELAHCDSCCAFCQELASLALSEMTELQRRQEQLLADLGRLRQIRDILAAEFSFHIELVTS